MSNSVLRDTSKDFAKKIVLLCRDMKTRSKESVLINQILRSGTSIGANIHEANYASSKADFVAKMQIALKEANETGKWLEMLYKTDYIDEDAYKYINKTCSTIRILLIASIKTAKSNI